MNAPRPAPSVVVTWLYNLLGRERSEDGKNFLIDRVQLTLKADDDGTVSAPYASVWFGGAPHAISNASLKEVADWIVAIEGGCVGGVTPPGTDREEPRNLEAALLRLKESRSIAIDSELKNGLVNFGFADPA